MVIYIHLLLWFAVLGAVDGCMGQVPNNRTNNTLAAQTRNEPGYKIYTKRFCERLKTVVNVSDLQSWAVKTIAATTIKDGEGPPAKGVSIPREKLPPFLSKLDEGVPLSASVILETKTVKPHVSILWGSGRAFYGILIGPPDFRPSKTFNYYIEWRPGVYVWHSSK